MAYHLVILRRAQKELAKIPEPDYQRVTTAIQALVEVHATRMYQTNGA